MSGNGVRVVREVRGIEGRICISGNGVIVVIEEREVREQGRIYYGSTQFERTPFVALRTTCFQHQ